MITQEDLLILLHYEPTTGLFNWKVSESRRVKVGDLAGTMHNGYIRIRIRGKAYPAHRLAWLYIHNNWPVAIDHINLDRSDNRIINLREFICSSDNSSNTTARTNNILGIKGVYWHESKGCYIAKFRYKGLEYSSRFNKVEEAKEWLSIKRRDIIGEFANNG